MEDKIKNYENNYNDIPVLFITFNRLNSTKLVFSAIRKQAPKKLYISSDGPRNSHPEDEIKIKAIRDYIDNSIDWPCTVKRKYSDANLGCMINPASSISWMLSREEYGIILEDDCIPSLDFFRFCGYLLNKYKNHENVYAITGDRFSKGNMRYSYGFNHILQPWGWATWRRAWEQYSTKIENPLEINKSAIFKKLPKRSRDFWIENFLLVHKNGIDAWDYQFIYMLFKHEKYVVFPKENLVKNIGFSEEATHTKSSNDLFCVDVKNIDFPLLDPPRVSLSLKYFWYMNRLYTKRTIYIKIRMKIERLFNRLFKNIGVNGVN